MLRLLGKLKAIEATGVLRVDLSWLSGNYQQVLFHQVRKSSAARLRELTESRRRAALVCFLWQSYRDAVDQAVDMLDKLLVRAQTQAQNELDHQRSRQRQTIQVSLAALSSLSRINLDDSIPDGELRARLFAEVPREELTACTEEIGVYTVYKLQRMAAPTTRLYLLCFAYQRLREINDNLIEAFIHLVDSYERDAKLSAKESVLRGEKLASVRILLYWLTIIAWALGRNA
jgi:hypothetical protein